MKSKILILGGVVINLIIAIIALIKLNFIGIVFPVFLIILFFVFKSRKVISYTLLILTLVLISYRYYIENQVKYVVYRYQSNYSGKVFIVYNFPDTEKLDFYNNTFFLTLKSPTIIKYTGIKLHQFNVPYLFYNIDTDTHLGGYSIDSEKQLDFHIKDTVITNVSNSKIGLFSFVVNHKTDSILLGDYILYRDSLLDVLQNTEF